MNPIFARQAGIAQGNLIQSAAAQKYADSLASLNSKIPGLVQKQVYDQQKLAQDYSIASMKAKSVAAQKLIDNAFRQRGLDIQEYSARRPRVGSGGGTKPITPSALVNLTANAYKGIDDLIKGYVPVSQFGDASWSRTPSEIAQEAVDAYGPSLMSIPGMTSERAKSIIVNKIAATPGYDAAYAAEQEKALANTRIADSFGGLNPTLNK